MSLGTALLLPVVHWGDLRCLPGFSGLSCPSQSRFECPPLALVGYGHPKSSGVYASSHSSGGDDDGRDRVCLLLPHRVDAAWVQDLVAFSVIGWAWGPFTCLFFSSPSFPGEVWSGSFSQQFGPGFLRCRGSLCLSPLSSLRVVFLLFCERLGFSFGTYHFKGVLIVLANVACGTYQFSQGHPSTWLHLSGIAVYVPSLQVDLFT